MRIFLKWILILAVFLLLNLLLNLTYYNPAIAVPAFELLSKYHLAQFIGKTEKVLYLKPDESELYPLTSITRLQSNLFTGPRAAVEGIVTERIKATDNDWHINIKDFDSERVLVAEIAPDHPLSVPLKGEKIKIWGITRYDLDHRWWELHPVMGWEKIK